MGGPMPSDQIDPSYRNRQGTPRSLTVFDHEMKSMAEAERGSGHRFPLGGQKKRRIAAALHKRQVVYAGTVSFLGPGSCRA